MQWRPTTVTKKMYAAAFRNGFWFVGWLVAFVDSFQLFAMNIEIACDSTSLARWLMNEYESGEKCRGAVPFFLLFLFHKMSTKHVTIMRLWKLLTTERCLRNWFWEKLFDHFLVKNGEMLSYSELLQRMVNDCGGLMSMNCNVDHFFEFFFFFFSM